MPPRAILLDCDGVLADQENHHAAAWQRILGTMGLPLDDETAARSVEVDDRKFLADIFEERDIPVDRVDDWVERKRALVAELLHFSPRLRPGAIELVEALQGHARLGLISGSGRVEVAAIMEGAGLADAFTAIIADEDIDKRHPDSEAFRLATAKLKLSVSSIATVVGSESMLSAAHEAGLRRIVAIGDLPEIVDQTSIKALTPVENVLAALGF